MNTLISIYAIPDLKNIEIPNPYRNSRQRIINIVVEEVLKHFGTSWFKIDKKSRLRDVVLPRQVIMYFLNIYLKVPLKEIGAMFSQRFDHATVIHGRETVRDLITTGEISSDINCIIDSIYNNHSLKF